MVFRFALHLPHYLRRNFLAFSRSAGSTHVGPSHAATSRTLYAERPQQLHYYHHDASLNSRDPGPGEQPKYFRPMPPCRFKDRRIPPLDPSDQLPQPGGKK
ncbi:hypothetical protein NPIL_484301 [Nephila pilipes]|uniref:Uncharacterized protein n=1 Tax=Nephila pilipes TaxID=299642 RepID=A0A8X6UG57_NEPPI|nr:hypothetical protein NPIL_484301 [Nephila pilipes]